MWKSIKNDYGDTDVKIKLVKQRNKTIELRKVWTRYEPESALLNLGWRIDEAVLQRFMKYTNLVVERSEMVETKFYGSKWYLMLKNVDNYLVICVLSSGAIVPIFSRCAIAVKTGGDSEARKLQEIAWKPESESMTSLRLPFDFLEGAEHWRDKYISISATIAVATRSDYPFDKVPAFSDFAIPHQQPKPDNGLAKLLDEELFSDVSFLVDRTTIKAHRAILCARSSFFSAMFTSDFVESKSSDIHIFDVKPDIFRVIIKYIYTFELPANIGPVAVDLLVAADRFGVEQLIEICEAYLRASITLENIAEILVLADKHSRPNLMKEVLTYLKENFKQVVASTEWRQLKVEHLELVCKTLEMMHQM